MAAPAPRQCLLRGAAPPPTLEHADPGPAGRRTGRTGSDGLGRRPGRPGSRVRAAHVRSIARSSSCTTTPGSRSPEIADIVGVPVGTVKSRLHHATRTLRAAIVADSQVDSHGGTTGMTVERDPDAILAAWLEEGPTVLPEPTRRAIAVSTRNVHRSRLPTWLPWRDPNMNGMSRLALAAVAVVAIVVGGLVVLRPGADQPGGVGGPGSPVPSVSAAPSPSATPVGVSAAVSRREPRAVGRGADAGIHLAHVRLLDPVPGRLGRDADDRGWTDTWRRRRTSSPRPGAGSSAPCRGPSRTESSSMTGSSPTLQHSDDPGVHASTRHHGTGDRRRP